MGLPIAFLFLPFVKHLKRRRVGVLECEGDETASGLELSYLVVVAMLWHIWPGTEILLKVIAQLLPELTGTVVGRNLVILLKSDQLSILLGEHQTVVLRRVSHHHTGKGRISLGRVNGKATSYQRVAEGLER